MITSGLMSSDSMEWATPQDLFDELDAEFHFTLDACANELNHKVANYYTVEQDGLAQEWTGTVWMNPPYGRVIGAWMRKAYESSGGGRQLFASYLREQIRLGGMITPLRATSGFCVAVSSLFCRVMIGATLPRFCRPLLCLEGVK
jgi:hypothetical protein